MGAGSFLRYVLTDERGFLGISLKKVFSHPFGKHSLFAKATQIASILPIPGAGLIGKAFGLMNRAHRTYDALAGRVAPILNAAGAAGFIPSTAPIGVMPGGTRTLQGGGRPTVHRATTHRAVKHKRRKRRR